MYPYIVNDPGIVCTPTKFKKNVAKNGSNVIANAGIIGFSNIFEIRRKETNVPKLRITAM